MKGFTCFKQHDSMQCGLSCLQMICSHYGQEFSLNFLSNICHASSEGVSLHAVAEAAEELGFHSMGGQITLRRLANIRLPCILHWNQNHFDLTVIIRARATCAQNICHAGKFA